MVSIKAPLVPAKVPFSTALPVDVVKALALHSAKTGTPKNRLVEKALRKLLKLA
jgi:hypothetical protein